MPRSALRCRPGGSRPGEFLTGLDELLGGPEGVLAQLRQAGRRIERGAADHPLIAAALAALDRALIEAGDAEDKIARAADALAFDPARLELAEARLFDIRGLARKHRVEPDALAPLASQMREQLAAIHAGNERIGELDQQLVEAREADAGLCREAEQPPPRNRGPARFRGRVRAWSAQARLGQNSGPLIDGAEPGPAGTDRVEFEV